MLSEEQIAINRLVCGNTAHSCKADYIKTAIKALETVQKLKERNMTMETLNDYMIFEDECIKKGFTFKSILEAREKQIPMKPVSGCDYIEDVRVSTTECPVCQYHDCDLEDSNDKKFNYCPNCGQKLDWGNKEWES